MEIKQLVHLENTSNKALKHLLKGNIAYSVLYRILQYDCKDIFHNDKSVIICYSAPPYPVWVWCKDANNTNDIISIANCIKTFYPLEKDYNVIVSYDVLNQLKTQDEYFKSVSYKMNMLTYQLNKINVLSRLTDGHAELANINDLDVIASMIKDMGYETEGFEFSLEESKKKVITHINTNTLYVWKNKNGKIVALTSKKVEGNYATIGSVYTLPTQRRKGYALNLVYTVSKELISNNITPILYTNENYTPSNECYKKIGFEQVGQLCNIKK